ncbi:NADPH-dependent FMN reductase [Antarctobacter heliothermus]|uniref:NAD(P)H-dependent FMN reductase n=1 Tax=Antarctobacter heliothermus TaxID=74033 RepID=A0A239E6S8_9RHOB|nr:NAD(P)H-dependent oxidoreductase [Antarctobacter heliothermus]SNS40149.1 NAD(P)H-dependent FMN reductase [Antarctobacter heliothermus]
MSDMKLVGLCGSLRAESSNRKLMFEAARLFAPDAFTELDLRFPLFDEDSQNADGIPAAVQQAADQIAGADAVLVVTPEYNKGISGVLKNALDWISRTEGTPWQDKPVALLSAAAGRAGGERAQNMARLCLTPFRPRLVAGPEMMLAQSRSQFGDDGRLIDARGQGLLQSLMEELRTEVGRMRD